MGDKNNDNDNNNDYSDDHITDFCVYINMNQD
jgi:hypothetical protein